MILLTKDSDLLKLPEQLYGTIKRVGILNKEPILYGDVNLLKPNDLYYISGAKQVYRYVKAVIGDNSQSEESETSPGIGMTLPGGPGIGPTLPQEDQDTSNVSYLFTTVKPIITDGISVPQDEKGTIRNAGYLFNEIIYSGDPNLVSNGSLFYHDTLPYISIVETNKENNILLATKILNEEGEVVTNYQIYKPEGNAYDSQYLTITGVDGESKFTIGIPEELSTDTFRSISYSLDNGITWIETENSDEEDIDIEVTTLKEGDTILLRGIGISTSNGTDSISLDCAASFNVSGNIMSLLYGKDFKSHNAFPKNSTYNFYELFKGAYIVSAENLILPARTLTNSCYAGMFTDSRLETTPKLPAKNLAVSCYASMFASCANLTSAPELPATTLANNCYERMFMECEILETAPELPATELAQYCYTEMFKDCIALTECPALPATELAPRCYQKMFSGCIDVTRSPKLPALTLKIRCYDNMFYGCSKLNSVAMLATDITANNCVLDWLYGVNATGIFVKNVDATWSNTGVVPSNWSVVTERD